MVFELRRRRREGLLSMSGTKLPGALLVTGFDYCETCLGAVIPSVVR